VAEAVDPISQYVGPNCEVQLVERLEQDPDLGIVGRIEARAPRSGTMPCWMDRLGKPIDEYNRASTPKT